MYGCSPSARTGDNTPRAISAQGRWGRPGQSCYAGQGCYARTVVPRTPAGNTRTAGRLSPAYLRQREDGRAPHTYLLAIATVSEFAAGKVPCTGLPWRTGTTTRSSLASHTCGLSMSCRSEAPTVLTPVLPLVFLARHGNALKWLENPPLRRRVGSDLTLHDFPGT